MSILPIDPASKRPCPSVFTVAIPKDELSIIFFNLLEQLQLGKTQDQAADEVSKTECVLPVLQPLTFREIKTEVQGFCEANDDATEFSNRLETATKRLHGIALENSHYKELVQRRADEVEKVNRLFRGDTESSINSLLGRAQELKSQPGLTREDALDFANELREWSRLKDYLDPRENEQIQDLITFWRHERIDIHMGRYSGLVSHLQPFQEKLSQLGRHVCEYMSLAERLTVRKDAAPLPLVQGIYLAHADAIYPAAEHLFLGLIGRSSFEDKDIILSGRNPIEIPEKERGQFINEIVDLVFKDYPSWDFDSWVMLLIEKIEDKAALEFQLNSSTKDEKICLLLDLFKSPFETLDDLKESLQDEGRKRKIDSIS